MNRGEGLRIAARAKNGTVGLFPEEKKVKKKQFGYKSRTQSYPVRKAETGVDSKDLGKQRKQDHHQGTSSAKQKATTKETNHHQKERSATLNTNKSKKGSDPRKPATDFVKKNKALSGTSDSTKKNSQVGVTGNTITLTEEQLNAILQSIGSAPDRSSAPAIAIEEGKVKVENVSKVETKDTDGLEKEKLDKEKNDDEGSRGKDEKEEKSESSKNEKDEDDKKTVASENILSLLNQLEESEGTNNAKTEVSSKPPSLPQTADSNSRRIDQSGTPQRNSKELQWGNSVGLGDIGAAIGSQNVSTLTLQERKRQEWKKALDEQVAEQKKRKEQEDILRKSLDGPGLYQRQGTPQRAEKNASSSISNSNAKQDFSSEVVTTEASSLGHFPYQSNVPAAMRSNFIIGGSGGQWGIDHNAEVKKKEQQEWIKEIEKQKREALERKDEERRRRQKMDDAVDATILRTSVSSRAEPEKQDHLNESKPQRVESSFLPTSDPGDVLSPRQPGGGALSTQRGMTLIDPAEMERREKARQKHLEHMRAVQAQVEEKQRLKREADEKRRREEAEEERRLALEREALQKQFDMENEKQREKEEAAAAKQKALEEGIRNAEQEALAAKHARRVKRLNEQGHDTSNLRNSWDAQHVTESSPRQVVHSSQKSHRVLHSPPPLMETQNIPIDTGTNHQKPSRDSPEEKRDVGTSTFSEQSTQTGFEFIPNLSPRLLEVIRQASAGIEYRASRESEEGGTKRDKRTKSHESPQRRNDRVSDRPAERIEKVQTERKPEKPKWGQNKTKKKISNSDKDLSKVGKGREARRRKRQEELLAQQERLTRRRDSLKKRGASSSSGNNRDGDDNIDDDFRGDVNSKPAGSSDRVSSTTGNLSRDHSKLERIRNEQDVGRASVSGRSLPRDSPAVEGDFYPFLRSEDVKLNHQSVVVTPSREESPQKQTYFDTNTYSPSSQMDPLLNPERIKDSSQRQERILEQLSHLRQGLMMKQREIELGLSPTVMM